MSSVYSPEVFTEESPDERSKVPRRPFFCFRRLSIVEAVEANVLYAPAKCVRVCDERVSHVKRKDLKRYDVLIARLMVFFFWCGKISPVRLGPPSGALFFFFIRSVDTPLWAFSSDATAQLLSNAN